MCYIWPSTEHSIHYASHSRSIRDSLHLLLFFVCLRRHRLRKHHPVAFRKIVSFGILQIEAFDNLVMYWAWESPSNLFVRSRKILIPRTKFASPKSFMENWLDNHSLLDVVSSLLFPIRRMSST